MLQVVSKQDMYLATGIHARHLTQESASEGGLQRRRGNNTIVARHGTKKARHGVSTRMSKAGFNKIAVSDGGNRQISARAPLDTHNSVYNESFNSDSSL